MRQEFQVHRLNEAGLEKAGKIAERFSTFLDDLEALCGADGRDIAIVRTKLQEANFFAKRSIATIKANQA